MKRKWGRNAVTDWDAMRPVLGTVRDEVLAERLGCSVQTVAYRRQLYGIAPAPPGPYPCRMGPWLHLLGTMPDRELAELAGVTVAWAAQRRRNLCIPPFGRDKWQGRDPAGRHGR